MASTYVIPDLHGRADLLHLALAEISARKPGTVVLLGDYVDKGPNSNGVITRLKRSTLRVLLLGKAITTR